MASLFAKMSIWFTHLYYADVLTCQHSRASISARQDSQVVHKDALTCVMNKTYRTEGCMNQLNNQPPSYRFYMMYVHISLDYVSRLRAGNGWWCVRAVLVAFPPLLAAIRWLTGGNMGIYSLRIHGFSSLLYRGINIAFASMIHADVMIILVGLTLNISVFNEHI